MSVKVNQNIAISETGFVFNPGTGESFTINPTGARFITLLREGMSDEEIIIKMCSEYEVDEKDLERDLHDFKQSLKHHHLTSEND
jgi:hypothetical protein